MDSSVSPKDEIWFLRVCHHISNAVYQNIFRDSSLEERIILKRILNKGNGKEVTVLL